MTTHEFLKAPEGFRIEKSADVDADEIRYVFMVDRSYAYRSLLSAAEASIIADQLDDLIVRSGMERLIADLEQCIAKAKEQYSDGQS